MIPIKNASSDMKSAASPRKETTRLSALAIGLRLMMTAAPKTSMSVAAAQKKKGDIIVRRRLPPPCHVERSKTSLTISGGESDGKPSSILRSAQDDKDSFPLVPF